MLWILLEIFIYIILIGGLIYISPIIIKDIVETFKEDFINKD